MTSGAVPSFSRSSARSEMAAVKDNTRRETIGRPAFAISVFICSDVSREIADIKSAVADLSVSRPGLQPRVKQSNSPATVPDRPDGCEQNSRLVRIWPCLRLPCLLPPNQIPARESRFLWEITPANRMTESACDQVPQGTAAPNCQGIRAHRHLQSRARRGSALLLDGPT